MPDKELFVSLCGCLRNVSLRENEGRSEGMLGKQCPFSAFALRGEELGHRKKG